MKKLFSILAIFTVLTTIILSCGSEDEDAKFATYGSLEGTWVIASSEYSDNVISGDGSTLTFSDCGELCSGTDYMASDKTTGEFAYSIADDNSYITIVDNSDAGGAYSGSWKVISYKENRLKLSIDSGSYGTMIITLEK